VPARYRARSASHEGHNSGYRHPRARGTEMLMPLWLRLMGALNTPMFNTKIVR
jgi:hypothetical protein